MESNKKLIILKGIDRTKDVEYYEEQGEVVKVKFTGNSKSYSYDAYNIEILDKTEDIDIKDKFVYYNNQQLFDVMEVMRFDCYFKIVFKNKDSKVFKYNEIEFRDSGDYQVEIINYFKEISKYVKIEDDKEIKNSSETFLEREFKKIKFVDYRSVLSYFLYKKNIQEYNEIPQDIIFPFRFNKSQSLAIKNVFKKNISIIMGPPGTGKTQTILNIIANLAFIQNKTVAVVSNNNEAVKNVKDKLFKYGYPFVVADLGNVKKKKKFFENLIQPEVDKYYVSTDIDSLMMELRSLNLKLDYMLDKDLKKARLEQEIRDYKLEQQYFNLYYEENNLDKIQGLPFYNQDTDYLLEFMFECDLFFKRKIKFFSKIKFLFKYHLKNLKDLEQSLILYVLEVQKLFYIMKIKKLEQELETLENELNESNFKEIKEKHEEVSKKIFHKKLYERYCDRKNNFDYYTYKKNMKEFVCSFPIVLSTTYSLRNCISEDFMFDYVIIDEASQVDLLAGSLALSCAKNAIIVGDDKQLPQIVDNKIKSLIGNYEIIDYYNYFENSILSSLCNLYGDSVPKETLIEHYRCHPTIINFCNRRYYNNQLVSFPSEEHLKVNKPLVLYHTVEGNHMRKICNGVKKGIYNQRELDVIKEEVLKNPLINNYDDKDIGVTTPYRLQADKMSEYLDSDSEVQSDTIHKYQGREKKLMIMSTVLDNSNQSKSGISFVDDACMLNVAVSRAIEQFVLVTDNNLFHHEGEEINSLLQYIEYQTMDSRIIESNLVSIFDLLYKEYSVRLDVLSKKLLNRSKYKSENIVDTILYYEFLKEEYNSYMYHRNVFLKNIFKNYDEYLSREEIKYINNNSSVDFIISFKMNGMPVLGIEVDGFASHENNPKQLEKDRLKDSIFDKSGIKLIRLKTNGYIDEKDFISNLKNLLFDSRKNVVKYTFVD